MNKVIDRRTPHLDTRLHVHPIPIVGPDLQSNKEQHFRLTRTRVCLQMYCTPQFGLGPHIQEIGHPHTSQYVLEDNYGIQLQRIQGLRGM